MTNKKVRTTISMPSYVHKTLRREALEKHISLNDLLLEKILAKNEEDIAKTLADIRKISKRANTKNINYRELIDYGRKY